MLRTKTISYKTILFTSFFVMAAICFLNLNYPLSVRFGFSRPLSLIILACCGLCLLTTRYSVTRALSGVGLLFFAWMITFMGIGSLSGLIMGTFGDRAVYMISVYVNSLLVIAVSAVVGFNAAQEHSLRPFLRVLFFICMTSTMLIYASDPLAAFFNLDRAAIGRSAGLFYNPNEAGQMCCLTLLLGFAMLRGSRFPMVYLACIALIYGATLLTFSKTAILTAGFLTLSQIATLRGNRRFGLWWGFLAVFFLIGFWWLLSVDTRYLDFSVTGKRRIHQLRSLVVEQELNEETTTHRSFLYRYGFDRFTESPVIGHGLGSFTKFEGLRMGCHNTYLMVFGEAGGLVGIFFLFVLARWGITILRARSPVIRQLAMGYLIVMMLAFMVSHNELYRRYHNIFQGMVIGLIVGRAYYRERLQQRQAAFEQMPRAVREPTPNVPLPVMRSREVPS